MRRTVGYPRTSALCWHLLFPTTDERPCGCGCPPRHCGVTRCHGPREARRAARRATPGAAQSPKAHSGGATSQFDPQVWARARNRWPSYAARPPLTARRQPLAVSRPAQAARGRAPRRSPRRAAGAGGCSPRRARSAVACGQRAGGGALRWGARDMRMQRGRLMRARHTAHSAALTPYATYGKRLYSFGGDKGMIKQSRHATHDPHPVGLPRSGGAGGAAWMPWGVAACMCARGCDCWPPAPPTALLGRPAEGRRV